MLNCVQTDCRNMIYKYNIYDMTYEYDDDEAGVSNLKNFSDMKIWPSTELRARVDHTSSSIRSLRKIFLFANSLLNCRRVLLAILSARTLSHFTAAYVYRVSLTRIVHKMKVNCLLSTVNNGLCLDFKNKS